LVTSASGDDARLGEAGGGVPPLAGESRAIRLGLLPIYRGREYRK